MNTLPVYVILLDRDYRVPLANRFFEERFGKALGRRCFEYLFGRDSPCEVCETFKVFKTGGPVRWEWTGPDHRTYDIYDTPFVDVDGSPLILEVGIDITERKRAEAEVRRLNADLEQRVAARTAEVVAAHARLTETNSELQKLAAELAQRMEQTRREAAELDLLYREAPIGLAMFDMQLRFLRINRRLAEIYGVEAGDQLGRRLGDVVPALANRADQLAQQLLTTGEPILNLDWSCETPSRPGVKRYFNEHWYPHKDDTGHLWAMNLVVEEVTTSPRAAEAMRNKTDELEASNRELEAFSYSVSHDLRAPLRAIDGFARILRQEYAQNLDTEGLRLLGVVSSEANRMGQLIDELLSFSRVGRQEMSTRLVDMKSLAQEEYDRCIAAEPDRRYHLTLGDLPAARGDPSMLRQVFANLISNAVKYSRGRPTAEIEIDGHTDAHACVYTVKDNGVGFDMRYVGKLFGIFQRLHPDVEFQGTGVGLALARRIVERHGGKIRGEGVVDRGATFTFMLPARGGEP